MNVSVRDHLARSPAQAYGAPAIAFHWITAMLVAIVGAIGLFFDDFPKSAFPGWLTVHACLGVAMFLLVVWRLWWRATHRPPDLPGTIGEFTRRTSHAAHMIIYLLLLATPVLGFTTFVAHGRKFVFGPYRLGFAYPATRSVFHPTEVVHTYLAYALFALAGVHILAALYHQFLLRDGLIRRIWPAAGA